MVAEIAARLELNGKQFSEEFNSTFGGIEASAKSSATKINAAFQSGLADAPAGFEQQFKTSFSRIRDQADQLVKGSNGKFAIDLSGVSAATSASRDRLESLRALDAALIKTTALEGELSEKTRATLAASSAAVRSAEEETRALLARERSLTQINTALGGTIAQQNRATVSTGQFKAGTQQLAFNLNDVGASLSSGSSLIQVFSQQGSQFVQAVSLMTGATGGFLGFLAGPWGAGLLAAGTILAAFAFKHDASSESTKKNKDSQKSFSDTIAEQNRRLKENIMLQSDKNKSELNYAQLRTQISAAQINGLETERKSPLLIDTTKGIGSVFAASQAKQKEKERNEEIDAKLVQLKRDRVLAQENERLISIAEIDRRNKGKFDKRTAETNRYEEALALAQNQAKKTIITDAEYERQSTALLAVHNANTAAIEKQTQADRANASGKQKLAAVTLSEARAVAESLGARITRDFSTPEENKKIGGAKDSYHLISQGIDIGLTDKAGKPLTKASIRAAYAKQGILLKQLLGPGDKGHDDHFHVAFAKKRGTAEQVADSTLASLNVETRKAEAANRALEASLERLIKKYDPAAGAARDYADALEAIEAALSGDKITADQASELRLGAQLEYYDKAKEAEEEIQSDVAKNIIEQGNLAGDRIDATAKKEFEAANEKQQYDKRLEDEKAAREKQRIQRLASYFESIFAGDIDSIWKRFEQRGREAISIFASEQSLKLLSRLGVSDKTLKGITKSAELGAGIAGIGKDFGFKTSTAGGSIGGVLGKLSGIPGGDIIGSIAGSLIGGALKKTKKGSAALGFANGELGLGASAGNSGSRIDTAKGGIGAVGDALNQIAAALGGTVSGAGRVSLGVRGKNFVVDQSGKNRTKGAGVLSFKDEEAAIRAALADALKDGVIAGISDASKAILQSGQQFEKALAKAELIEGIPKLLKARLDPVGAALDELNTRWDRTIAALKEGGASTAQIADAQKLYNLELEETKASTKAGSADLRSFLDGFKFGGDSPFSLNDQLGSAEAALAPFLAKIDAGQSIDLQAYLAAAQSKLDLNREIEGGTAGYFAELGKITAYTEKAIATIDNATSINAARDPFVQATATNTATANDLLDQVSRQLVTANLLQADTNALLKQMSSGSGFIGTNRSFAA